MKDHVRTQKYISLEGGAFDVINEIKEATEGMIDPEITNDSWGGDPDYVVRGWRPMNERELEKAKKTRERERLAKKAAKEKAEQQEREEYERLRAKFESQASSD